METHEVVKIRGKVIERSINIETIINTLITQHYLGKINLNFFTEVLYDEYFSLALKINILSKFLGTESKPYIEKLRMISQIRNRFAHSGLVVDGKYPDPKNINKEINFQELFNKFEVFASELEIYLSDKAKEKGVEFHKK